MDKIDQLIVFILPVVFLIIGGIIWFQQNSKFIKANKILNKGEYASALELYKNIIEKNKKHKLAYYNMGICLKELNKHKDAIEAFDNVIALDPNYPNAYLNKTDTLMLLGKYNEAIQMLDEIIKIEKRTTNKQKKLNLIFINKGKILSENLHLDKEAIESFNDAIKINKNSKETYLMKRKITNRLKDYEEEIKTCNEIIRIDKNSLTFYNIKRVALENLGKHEEALETINEAIKIYEQAIKIDTNNDQSREALGLNKGNLYYFKSCTYNFLNRLEDTLSNLKIAIELNKNCIADAKKNKIFDNIRDLSEFKEIIGD